MPRPKSAADCFGLAIYLFAGCVISPVEAGIGFDREISALNALLSRELTEFV